MGGTWQNTFLKMFVLAPSHPGTNKSLLCVYTFIKSLFSPSALGVACLLLSLHGEFALTLAGECLCVCNQKKWERKCSKIDSGAQSSRDAQMHFQQHSLGMAPASPLPSDYGKYCVLSTLHALFQNCSSFPKMLKLTQNHLIMGRAVGPR